jgi:hypothetical protein
MLRQAVPRKLSIERCHEAVSANLRDDRRRGNRSHRLITPDKPALRLRYRRLIATIDEQEIRVAR